MRINPLALVYDCTEEEDLHKDLSKWKVGIVKEFGHKMLTKSWKKDMQNENPFQQTFDFVQKSLLY